MMAPASRSFCTMKASLGGMEPSRITEPPVVGISTVSKLSFSTTGMPCKGPRTLPALRSASNALAWSMALGFSEITACSFGPCRSNASIRARLSCMSFSAVSWPDAMAPCSSAIVASSNGTDLAEAAAEPSSVAPTATTDANVIKPRFAG